MLIAQFLYGVLHTGRGYWEDSRSTANLPHDTAICQDVARTALRRGLSTVQRSDSARPGRWRTEGICWRGPDHRIEPYRLGSPAAVILFVPGPCRVGHRLDRYQRNQIEW
jgi:hypothetical protein